MSVGGLRCELDDLAIVTKCGVRARIGLLVRVIARCTDGGYDWLTEVEGGGILGRDLKTGRLGWCKHVLMHDWNLTPIREEDPPHQQSNQEAAPVVRIA
jgi:hypothetical protein